MSVLGKDLFDFQRSHTNTKVEFGASGYWVEMVPEMQPYRREYTSERHFRQSVDEYICFYNEVRPHATLKYKTPQAFEAAYTNDYIEKTCSNSGGG